MRMRLTCVLTVGLLDHELGRDLAVREPTAINSSTSRSRGVSASSRLPAEASAIGCSVMRSITRRA
jgi:hypothetical protein